MIPDLGRYAVEVTLAYGVSLALLGALTGWIWLRGQQVRRALEAIETRARNKR
ncbi:heme exporter protein CcmD [Pararhodobacter sp.]|uniref:heme exporter protein CcmD n=1 Tax=Pararhodobacter sp. TaxID=2127056 RepID=UPI002FDC8303